MTHRSPRRKIQLADPVTVAVSAPEEQRWGTCQFPRLSRLPGSPEGALLLTYNQCRDDDLLGEACLALTVDQELLCVMRRTDHRQKPMACSRSRDGGRTWSPLEPLHHFGVLPQLRLLGNGVLVLAFGRPGVWLSCAPDGVGRHWTEPVPVVAGDPAAPTAHSCGYTDLLALDERTLLLAYSDFQHVDGQGVRRKAIQVRRVEVRRD